MRISTSQPRDESAWYHVVVTADKAANTMKMYVNNQIVNQGVYNEFKGGQVIGKYSSSVFGGGYMADLYFVEQALPPETFGRINANGVWVPVAPSGLTYGINGWRLTFADPNDVGKDYSGSGNDFTPYGFETVDTSSSDYDLMQDSPTQNWATFNPNDFSSGFASTYSDANLRASGSNNWSPNRSTIPFPTSGKWYVEYNLSSLNFNASSLYGMVDITTNLTPGYSYTNYLNPGWGIGMSGSSWYLDGVLQSGQAGPNLNTTSGGVVMIAFDADTGEVWLGSNGAWTTDPSTAALINLDVSRQYILNVSSSSVSAPINFGQQPFLYTPPAGYNALQTKNLPASTIPNSREHFQAITDTGANILTTAQAAFPSGLWWIKDRVNANQHQLVDSVRGGNLALECPATAAETAYVPPTGDSVAWCWKASANIITNNDGAIESQVSTNTVAGFSIVTYTGTGSASTIGHGLTTNPEFVIYKSRDGAGVWFVYTKETGGDKYLRLDGSGAATTLSSAFNGMDPTTSVLNVGTSTHTNASGVDYVAYAWTSIPGYSAFGSYTGNANADGPFVYTGFKPAFVMIKATSGSNLGWRISHNGASPNNPVNANLLADSTAYESTSSADDIDYLSNGFKLRGNRTATNGSGTTLIYAAFAENPFNAPATAR